MKLLILSNYFTPDLGAGSFRIQGLIEALEPYRKEDLSVDLITTMPNRYADTKVKALSYEDRGCFESTELICPVIRMVW